MDDAAPLIDRTTLDALEQAIGAAKLRGFVREYLTEARRSVAALGVAQDGADGATLYRLAHNLVSTAGNFGALEVSRIADDLQQAARRGDDAPIAELIARLDAAVAAAEAELLALYGRD